MKIIKPFWINQKGLSLYSLDIQPEQSSSPIRRLATSGTIDDTGCISIWDITNLLTTSKGNKIESTNVIKIPQILPNSTHGIEKGEISARKIKESPHAMPSISSSTHTLNVRPQTSIISGNGIKCDESASLLAMFDLQKQKSAHQQITTTHQQISPAHQHPTHRQISPAHQQITPTHQSISAAHQSIPAAHQSIPAGRQTIPAVHQPIPAQRITLTHQPIPAAYQHIIPKHQPIPVVHKLIRAAHQPLSAVHQPLSAVHQPIPAVHQPIPAVHQPISALHQPIPAVHQPILAIHQPIPAIHQPIPELISAAKCKTKLVKNEVIDVDKLSIKSVKKSSTAETFDKQEKFKNKHRNLLCRMKQHLSCVNIVRWAPKTGKLLASGGDDSLIMLWKFQSKEQRKYTEYWQCVATLKGHASDVLCLEWSKDETRIASCGVDCNIRIWMILNILPNGKLNWECNAVLQGHQSIIKGVCWDPTSRFIASQSDDRTVRIWRTADWKEDACLDKPFTHSDSFNHCLRLHWSPDGQYLVCANATNNKVIPTAHLVSRQNWNLSTSSFVGHSRAISTIRFSQCLVLPNGSEPTDKCQYRCCMATAGKDRSVCVWVTGNRRPLVVIHDLFLSGIVDMCWTLSKNQKSSSHVLLNLVLAACSTDGSVALLRFNALDFQKYTIIREPQVDKFLSDTYGIYNDPKCSMPNETNDLNQYDAHNHSNVPIEIKVKRKLTNGEDKTILKKITPIAPTKIPTKCQQVPTSNVQQVLPLNVQKVPTLNVQQVSTPKVQQVPTLKVQQVPTPNVQQVPTVKVEQVPTPKVERASTTNVQQISTPKVEQAPTSNLNYQLPTLKLNSQQSTLKVNCQQLHTPKVNCQPLNCQILSINDDIIIETKGIKTNKQIKGIQLRCTHKNLGVMWNKNIAGVTQITRWIASNNTILIINDDGLAYILSLTSGHELTASFFVPAIQSISKILLKRDTLCIISVNSSLLRGFLFNINQKKLITEVIFPCNGFGGDTCELTLDEEFPLSMKNGNGNKMVYNYRSRLWINKSNQSY